MGSLHLAALLCVASGTAWLCCSGKGPGSTHPGDELDFFQPNRLPNRGHIENGTFRADTWDHFDIVACDRGPPDGATQLVHWVEKVKHWVNDTKGSWVNGAWQAGHYVTEKVNRSKWVPLTRTPEQEDCVGKQKEADEYHKKLIEQHNEFLEAKKADEDLLRWQSEHRCTPQHVAVNFVGPGEHDSNGDPSGAICQKLCTEKGADGFSWSRETGCWLKVKRGGQFEVQHMAGAYSGFPCEKVASYTPWITIEAQRKTLYDGLTVTQAPSVGPTTSMLCIMLVEAYSKEMDLVMDQHMLRTGVFMCDHSAVYSNQLLELPSGLKTRKIYSSQMVEKGGQWNVMLDTDVLMAMYRQVLKDPEWLQVKWIVRADPQCVFSTPNLRSLLSKEEMEAATEPTYLVAEDPGVGFPKFFQVMSQSALQRMAERSRACFWKMRYWGDQQYHGAAWMDECLKGTVGARRAKHRELVGKASGCLDSLVAFYPIKDAESQRTCYGKHTGPI